MSDMTTEKFAQRVFDFELADAHQIEAVWGECGSRDVPLEQFTGLMVRRELLTNFQVDRIVGGKQEGYYYGKYKVLYMVGAGTFARVYRAAHRETDKQYAVKVLRMRYSEDMATTEQFLREAQMVKPLVHPNICPVHDVLRERHRPFMVMDFIEGQNLRDFIRVRKRLDLDVSLRVIRDVLTGLQYAGSHGVTHRDLKLSNVLISSHGRAKLVDFGLAAITADMSDEAIVAAPNSRSIDYAGLERITGVRKNDTRSDIYFAGCMLYHTLSGVSPLVETRDRITRLSVSRYRDVTPLGQHVPGLPRSVVAFCHKAMDLNPERRFQTPGDMLNELKRVMARVEAGDVDTSTSIPEETADDEAAAAVSDATVEREGGDRTVMIIESNVKLQNTLRSALKKRGYRVLLFARPERALQRFAVHYDPEPLAHCVIFSANELGDEAVDAFNEFGNVEEIKDIAAILLVDRQNKAQIKRAATSDRRIVLPLGIKIKQLRAKLLQLFQEDEPSDS